MVHKYKRKTPQAKWDEASMKLAMEEAAKTSVRRAAKTFGINLSTLQRHIKKGSSDKKLGRFTPVFTNSQEQELLEYLFNMDNMFYGLTKSEFLELVYQYAEANKIEHPFKNGRAGEDWYIGFKSRHPDLTLRRPEPTSVARAKGFNRPQVERFFNILEEQIEKNNIDATRIYNVDETGIQTTSSKPPRILTKTGKKQVGVISSTERGKLTTAVCCCNAAGSFIPPFLIFGRKRMVGRLLDGAPPGTAATCTDNGWINGPTFLEWMRHFVNAVRPTPERKVLIVMDNHESHKYLEVLEFASKNNVVFVSLAPHTTHRMQPLDKCVYGPLKAYFEQEVSVFQRTHAGRIISQYEVARLFGPAYLKAASSHNAVSGFSSSGIWPTNRYIFKDSDFMPSTVTDRPEPSSTNNERAEVRPISGDVSEAVRNVPKSTNNDTADDDPIIGDLSETDAVPTQIISALGIRNSFDSDRTISRTVLDDFINDRNIILKTPTPATSGPDNLTHSLASVHGIDDNIYSKERPINPTPAETHAEKMINNSDSGDAVDDVFSSSTHVTPMDIRPSPKLEASQTTRRRRTQKAEVLTSTPIKEEQKQKEMKKKTTQEKKIDSVKKKIAKEQKVASTSKQQEKKSSQRQSKIEPVKSKLTEDMTVDSTNKQKEKKEMKMKSLQQIKIESAKRKLTKDMAVASTSQAVKKRGMKNPKIVKGKENCRCLICHEPYTDPPVEDWIQCNDCQMWVHEACSSYSGIGSYYCDLCHE